MDRQPARTAPPSTGQQAQSSDAVVIAAIRQALWAMPTTPFKRPFPLVVPIEGGPTLQLMARIDSLARPGSKGVVHLAIVKRGRLLRGDPETWLTDNFVLTGKDELKQPGVPRVVSDAEAARFLAQFDAPAVAADACPPPEEGVQGPRP